MIRGRSLPVRGDDKMKWKYETDPNGDKCKCGKVETELQVLLECKLNKEKGTHGSMGTVSRRCEWKQVRKCERLW